MDILMTKERSVETDFSIASQPLRWEKTVCGEGRERDLKLRLTGQLLPKKRRKRKKREGKGPNQHDYGARKRKVLFVSYCWVKKEQGFLLLPDT